VEAATNFRVAPNERTFGSSLKLVIQKKTVRDESTQIHYAFHYAVVLHLHPIPTLYRLLTWQAMYIHIGLRIIAWHRTVSVYAFYIQISQARVTGLPIPQAAYSANRSLSCSAVIFRDFPAVSISSTASAWLNDFVFLCIQIFSAQKRNN